MRNQIDIDDCLGGATRTYRRRHQQPHSFHFATNSTQNVCFLLFFFLFFQIFFSPLDHPYSRSTTPLSILILDIDSWNIICQ